MVQILPQKTNLGTQFGQALGQGISQGAERGINRGMLQSAFKDLESLPTNSTPLQLAAKLMETTAGIPGSERYVGQLFPLLLQQMQSQAALGGTGTNPKEGTVPEGESPAPSTPSKGQSALDLQAESGKGFLSGYIPEDQINQEATQYAQSTMSGLEGYNLKRNQLLGQNANIEKQRAQVEQRFLAGGGKEEDVPLYMNIASKAKGKTAEEISRNARPEFKKYQDLSKSLENFSYPSVFGRLYRPETISKLQGTVKDMVGMGFEDKVRDTLSSKGLSPTEISELIHPISKDTKKELDSIPDWGLIAKTKSIGNRNEALQERDDKIKDFLSKNTNPNLSLLGVRKELIDKGYDWEKLGSLMRSFYEQEGAPQLTPEQIGELQTLEKEPPRDSLAYIFQSGSFDPSRAWEYARKER